MSAELLIQSLEKLLKLHKSLYDLAERKTEIIKKGDIEPLNQILKDEQTHIAAIQKLEQLRFESAKKIVPSSPNPSASDCLPYLDEQQQTSLQAIANELKEIVYKIKEKNDLNQQLLYQSMQFLYFTQSLIKPVRENFNYGPDIKKQSPKSGSGLFNSKA